MNSPESKPMLSPNVDARHAKNDIENTVYETVLPKMIELEKQISNHPEGKEKEDLENEYEDLSKVFESFSADVDEADKRIRDDEKLSPKPNVDLAVTAGKAMIYISPSGLVERWTPDELRESHSEMSGSAYGRSS